MNRTKHLSVRLAVVAITLVVVVFALISFRQKREPNNQEIQSKTVQSSLELAESAKLVTMMTSMTSKNKLKGSALLIGDTNDTHRHEVYFGEYNPSTQVAIASSTKWISATLIHILANKNYFNLDDRVADYLPQFNTPEKKQITIKMLLSMTSGFPENSNPLFPINPCINDKKTTLESCANLISQLTLENQPGTKINYSPYGYYIAALIAQKTTEVSWVELNQKYIFEPLEMNNTFYARPNNFWDKSSFTKDDNPNPSSGLVTNLLDYGKFLKFLINCDQNQKIDISCATLDEIYKDHFPQAQTAYTPEIIGNWRYAQGCWIISEYEYASIGGFGFYPWINRKSKYYGIIMVQDQLSNVFNDQEQIRNEVDSFLK